MEVLMSSSSLVRWGLLGALLAATAWTVSGIVAFVFGVAPFGPVGSLSWYLIESSDGIAEAGMLMALVGLHVRQVPNYGRLGMAGFIVAFVGTASSFVTTVIYILSFNRFETVVGVLQNLGILGWLVGFPLLGIATFRARVLPRWCGVLLAAFAPLLFLVFFLLDRSGAVRAFLGPYWLAVGYALWSRSAASEQPSRVR
jgi:hypothetical protein